MVILETLAKLTDSTVKGDKLVEIDAVAPLQSAKKEKLVLLVILNTLHL